MAEAANYTVVLQGTVILPAPDNNDIDFEYPTFNAPGLSTSTSVPDRPFYSSRSTRSTTTASSS